MKVMERLALAMLMSGLALGCGEKDGDTAATDDSAADDSAADDSAADDSAADDSAADDSAADDSGEEALSFAADVEPIIGSNCSPCHTSSASGGLSMAQGAAYGNLVGVPASNANMNRVTANDPANSYLWRKVEGTHAEVDGGGGDQMPKGSSPLGSADLATIDQWIRTGANP